MNVSSTKEFDISRVLSKGVHYIILFIIAMESLHVSIDTAYDLHFFRGISIPHNCISISHLMYVDNVTFISEWSTLNFVNLN